MTRRYVIPGAFDPSYSLLGRMLRRRFDRLAAEARYWLYVVTSGVTLTLLAFLAWALLHERIFADSSGTAVLVFFVVQLGALVAFLLACVAGFRPPVTITVDRRTIRLQQGGRYAEVEVEEICRAEIVDGLAFHRQYRRYAGVRVFEGASRTGYLLIQTPDEWIAAGIPPERRDDLLTILGERGGVAESQLSRVAQ